MGRGRYECRKAILSIHNCGVDTGHFWRGQVQAVMKMPRDFGLRI